MGCRRDQRDHWQLHAEISCKSCGHVLSTRPQIQFQVCNCGVKSRLTTVYDTMHLYSIPDSHDNVHVCP